MCGRWLTNCLSGKKLFARKLKVFKTYDFIAAKFICLDLKKVLFGKGEKETFKR